MEFAIQAKQKCWVQVVGKCSSFPRLLDICFHSFQNYSVANLVLLNNITINNRNQDGSLCDGPDICDGFGECIANWSENGVACGKPEDQCSFPEVCQDGLCVQSFKAAGTLCGDAPASSCDEFDECDVSYIHPSQSLVFPAYTF